MDNMNMPASPLSHDMNEYNEEVLADVRAAGEAFDEAQARLEDSVEYDHVAQKAVIS